MNGWDIFIVVMGVAVIIGPLMYGFWRNS